MLQVVTDKQIEEACLLNIKEARRVLYELQKEGLSEQMEVNAAQNSFCYRGKSEEFISKYGTSIMKVILVNSSLFYFIN